MGRDLKWIAHVLESALMVYACIRMLRGDIEMATLSVALAIYVRLTIKPE